MTEQKAIKELKEMYKDGCYIEESLDAVDKEEALNMAIKALKEQEKYRWIPIRERLPEDRRCVFVTAYWKQTRQVMMGFYYGFKKWCCVPFKKWCCVPFKAIKQKSS